MTNTKHRYQAYLLRLWAETSAGQPVWRASLEDSHTGTRQGFASLEQLFVFLKEQTEYYLQQRGFEDLKRRRTE
jgi:hypothetical protein